MKFGDKIKNLREQKNMTQQQLAESLGVSLRTISSYETKDVRPRYREIYDKLAELFEVPKTYLLSDEDDFILTAGEKFGYRGVADTKELTEAVVGLFAGGELSDEDKKAVLETIQEAYYMSKLNNKKYTPKKYIKNDEE